MDIKIDECGHRYLEELPETSKLIVGLHQLIKLKPNKKKWNQDNIQLNIGMKYLLKHSSLNIYYLKIIHEQTSMKILKNYIENNMIYVWK